MKRWCWVMCVCGLLLAGCANQDDAPAAPEAALDEGPPIDPTGKADGGPPVRAYDPLGPWTSLEQDFEVLFAPDDPVNTVETALIDEVIAARASDAATYEEGSNPYRIRYAVYNLRNPRIVDRLIAAEAAGVDVQILIEADQLSDAKTWNTADETLVDAGLELVKDHRSLNAETRATADLIGITGSGLMHLKSRLFTSPQGSALLTGSLNPGDNAMLNEETLHLVRDPALVARYEHAFDAVLTGSGLENTWSDTDALNVLFTPASSGPRAVEKVFDWLEDEDEQILLMVFSLRDLTAPGHSDSLVDLLTRKAQSGVPVYVITDRKQSDGIDADGKPRWRNDRTEDRLREGGVHVYEAINTAGPFNAMHHKVAVLGRSRIRVITDAANWTFSGLGSSTRRARNVESQLFIDASLLPTPRVGQRYLAQWLLVLDRYAGQTPEEPTSEAVRNALSAAEGWPTTPAHFIVHEAETAWGENIYVRGGVNALGRWGQSHPGHALTTDDSAYPTWSSVSPADLGLGSTVSWKAVARFDDGRTRWEAGGNRSRHIMPTALLDPERYPADACYIEGTWR